MVSNIRSTCSNSRNGPALPALACVLLLCVIPVIAGDSGSGHQQDYDYVDQGDDWYGRRALPRSDRDFEPTFLDQILSGEDFCLGYDKFFDRLKLGPPLFRTNENTADYLFRFSEADPDYPCIEGGIVSGGGTGCPGGCSDGLFCNGAEVCQGSSCVNGTPPCNDGNSCTQDSCNETLSSCQNVAPPLPDEVQELTIAPVGATSTIVLNWTVSVNATEYNLYRSLTGTVPDLGCFQQGLSGTSTTDDGLLPGRGAVFFYLPTGTNCSGEGSLGSGNPPQARIPGTPCT